MFTAKPVAQQAIFLRSVYFAELKAGGRGYNDPSSSRYGSYLRGRQAIAALFPEDRNYDHVRRLGHPRTVWRRYLDPHSTGVWICLHSDRVP